MPQILVLLYSCCQVITGVSVTGEKASIEAWKPADGADSTPLSGSWRDATSSTGRYYFLFFFSSIMFKFWSFLPTGTAAAVSAPALCACEALQKCGSQFVAEISGGRARCYGLLRLEVVVVLLLKNPRPAICVGGVCSARERHNATLWYSSNHLNATILSYTVAPNWV